MTLPRRPTPTHSWEDHHICPQRVGGPAGHLALGVGGQAVSTGRGVTGRSRLTLSAHCFQSAFWAPKPDKQVAPTALLPRSFRKRKVGHVSELRKGTRSVGRKRAQCASTAAAFSACSLSVCAFWGEKQARQREQHGQRRHGPWQVEVAGHKLRAERSVQAGEAGAGLRASCCSQACGPHSTGNGGGVEDGNVLK